MGQIKGFADLGAAMGIPPVKKEEKKMNYNAENKGNKNKADNNANKKNNDSMYNKAGGNYVGAPYNFVSFQMMLLK